jgi:hypothetical protein
MWSFTSYSTGIFGYAAFLNLDLDPQLEVFVTATAGYGSASTSYALDTDGSFMWSYSTPELGNQMIYTDVTGDSIPEIILATFQNVYVLDKYGSLILQYTPDSEEHNAYIAAGDITGDGIDDLALSRIDHFNTLYAVRNDGTELWNKSYGRDSSYNLSPPIVIDVDDDGAKEVIVYGGGAIHTYDGDGTELWTWGNSMFLPSYCWPGHFDVNRDSEEEIVFDKDGRVYALSLDGHLVMEFALPNNGAFILTGTGGHVKGCETPRWGEVADVNSDGCAELIIKEIIDGQYYVAAVLLTTRANIDFNPDTLNLKSKGQWITAYIELPEGYDVNDINVSSIMLNATVPAEPTPTAIGDYDSDGIPDLMVKFDRASVQQYILDNVPTEARFMTTVLTITGKLNDGTLFQGSGTIRIIFPMHYWRIFYLEKLGIA